MKINKIMKRCSLLLLILASGNALAAPSKVHTWHNVLVASGTWHVKLAMINESEKGWFVGRNGTALTDFVVTPKTPGYYGFGFEKGADFNIAYTLTATEQSAGFGFSAKTCVYVVTAASPANPDIRPESFNGATCNWTIASGVGEDFYIS